MTAQQIVAYAVVIFVLTGLLAIARRIYRTDGPPADANDEITGMGEPPRRYPTMSE